jgi:hypothetical protein
MARQQPPVPPANRSPKGPGSDPSSAAERKDDGKDGRGGQQENIAQNTRHQGYQQDR